VGDCFRWWISFQSHGPACRGSGEAEPLDTGERLDSVRTDNDPMALAAEIAKAERIKPRSQ
jgi:hypothetical protein